MSAFVKILRHGVQQNFVTLILDFIHSQVLLPLLYPYVVIDLLQCQSMLRVLPQQLLNQHVDE